MGFAINPPNTPLVDDRGYVSSAWYRWFARVQDVLGEDLVASIAAAPVLTHGATTAFSDDKILTQGSGLSFTSAATTLTVALAASGVTAASYGSASEVATFTVDTFGRLTLAANATITPAAIGAAASSLTLTAGAGLTGGGDLTANRTFDVGAGTGITVNANDVALDTANTRNVDHASVTFTAGAGLTGGGTLEANRTFDIGAGTGITVNANDVALDTASTRNTDHTAVSITAGAGLTGGGDISATRTLDVGAGTGITVNANDVALDTASTRNTDHTSVTLTAGNGLTGGGDISASRSFAVGSGTGISVAADAVAIADTAVTPASYGGSTSIPSFTVDQQGRLTAASGTTIYSEGSWTPTVAYATNGDFSPTYDFQQARYVRVHDVCHWWLRLQWDSNAYTTASGQLEIGGLPFTVRDDSTLGFEPGGTPFFSAVTFDATALYPVIFAVSNTTLLRMWQVQSAGSVIAMDIDNFLPSTNNIQIRASGSFRIDV